MSEHLKLWRECCMHHGVGSARRGSAKYAAIRKDYDKAKIHGTGFFGNVFKGIKTVAAQPFVQDLAKQGIQKGLEKLATSGGGVKKRGRKPKVSHMVKGEGFFEDLFS